PAYNQLKHATALMLGSRLGLRWKLLLVSQQWYVATCTDASQNACSLALLSGRILSVTASHKTVRRISTADIYAFGVASGKDGRGWPRLFCSRACQKYVSWPVDLIENPKNFYRLPISETTSEGGKKKKIWSGKEVKEDA